MKTVVLSSKISIDRYNKINFLIDEDLSKFINELNLKLFPISFKKKQVNLKDMSKSNGLILAGGGDIYKYNKIGINKIRDEYEKKLFKFFLKKNKPILLICRGFQLIADLYGIKLQKIKNHVRKFHSLNVSGSKYLKKSKIKVNSFHNFSIKKLPKEFKIISITNDDSIEIAEHKSKKILCLMFHPERKMPSQKIILKSIKNFF